MKRDETILVPLETIRQKIFDIRGQKVMLYSDLAILYGVETKVFNRAATRNLERFPEDFRFRLTSDEYEFLRSQFVTSKKGHGGRRHLPYVFTEQGVAMLSGVLKSKRAIEVNIGIMRAFVNMRKIISSNDEIKQKLAENETEIGEHSDHFKKVFAALTRISHGGSVLSENTAKESCSKLLKYSNSMVLEFWTRIRSSISRENA